MPISEIPGKLWAAGCRWRANPRGYWLVAAVLMAVHLGGLLHFYKPSMLLHNEVIASGDFSSYVPAMTEVRTVWRRHHALTGYSTSFMAGYPFGSWGSVGRKGFHVASLVLGALSVERASYLFVVAVLLGVPLLFFVGARLLGSTRLESLAVLALCVIVMQIDSLVVSIWSVGTLSTFLFGSGLAATYLGCLHRCTEGSAPLRFGVAAALVLALVVFVHPLIVVPLAIAGMVTLAVSPGVLREKRRLLAIGIAALGGWVLLVPYLAGLYGMLGDKIAYPASPRYLVGIRELFFDFAMDRAYKRVFDRRLMLQAVALLGLVGGLVAWRDRRKGVLAAALTGTVCMAVAYAFPFVPFLRQTEPYRYLVTGILLMTVPAVVGLAWIVGQVAAMELRQRLAVACVAALLVPSAVGYSVDAVTRPSGFHRQSALVRKQLKLLEALKPVQARLLCEDEALGSVVPYYLGVEVIGGYHSGWFPMTYGLYAHVSHRRVFGLSPEAPDAYDPARLNAYLDLYDVGLIAAVTPELTQALVDDPGWREVASMDKMRVFQRAGTVPGFVEGMPAATVTTKDDGLVVAGLPTGDFVLRYHYLPGMTAENGVALKPVKRLDDPAPFIGIENPHADGDIVIHCP